MDKDRSPLLPDRHPQVNLFVCDVADAVIKSDMASMEHPIFTLSKKPIRVVKRYEHGDVVLEVTPGPKGIANIYDKDILIFAISQIMAARNEGRPYTRDIQFQAQDFLEFSNRLRAAMIMICCVTPWIASIALASERQSKLGVKRHGKLLV